MASPTEAEEAVFARLGATDWAPLGAPTIVWSNTGDPQVTARTRPRIEVQPATKLNTTSTLAGSSDHVAEVALTVVVNEGRGHAELNPLLAVLNERFKPGTRFDGVEIWRLPDVRPPLLDGEYRVPVFIQYRTFVDQEA